MQAGAGKKHDPHMQHAQSIEIEAPPGVVWAVLADVQRWPSWTESVRRVEVLDEAALGTGLRARLDILGAPAAGTWEVTSYSDGKEFTWENRAPGVRTRAWHAVEPDGPGSRVTLGIEQTGPGTWLLRPWLSHVNRRNLSMESQGLKRQAEARVAARA